MATRKQETAEAVVPSDTDIQAHFEPDTIKDVTKDLKGLDFVPESWDDVAEAFGGELIVIEGSPYEVVKKDDLVGVPFVITDVRFYWSKEYDNPVAAICLLTQDNRKLVFNDGSTGVFEQIKQTVLTTKRKAGILCKNGLRKSEYEVEVFDAFKDETKTIKAATFYLS